jgi:signal peptidase II
MTVNKTTRSLLLLLLITTTVGCDRVTKNLAQTSLNGATTRSLFGDIVRLEYAENIGGFLSIGVNLGHDLRTAIFSVGTGLILLALLITAIQFRRRTSYLVGACLALSGGASNLLDRIMRDAVIDFMNVGLGDHLRTGIFNVADVAILLGISAMMFSLCQSERTVQS